MRKKLKKTDRICRFGYKGCLELLMSKIIQSIESEQMNKQMPDFGPGDTIIVHSRVKEGNRERLQAYEGVVIAMRNRGVSSTFTVRKISHGEGVERVFPIYSPLVAKVTIKRRGDVRKAKLYHLRNLRGKAARIKEKFASSGLNELVVEQSDNATQNEAE